MIELSDLRFGYRAAQPVLSGFSLTIPDGARICLSAPSGSGKTTLLRLLAGLEKPQAGSISGLSGLSLSMVFQEDRLLPHKTVLQNVALFSNDSRAAALLTELGLGSSLDCLPEELSGGMKRRAALARALAHPFDLLLLDEPFTGLDDDSKAVCLQAVRREIEGRTLVLSTHTPAEAEALGAEIILL